MTQSDPHAVVLLRRPVLPDPARLAAAARGLTGLALTAASQEPDRASYTSGGGPGLELRLARAPYPPAAGLQRGLTSPAAGDVEAAEAHLLFMATGLPSDPRRHDALLSRLTCAALQGLHEPLAAMLGHGVMFHRADLFRRTVQGEQPGALPLGVCVDLSIAQDRGGARVTFLTHGMSRYDRQEIFITSPRAASPAALELAAVRVRTVFESPPDALPDGSGPSDGELKPRRAPSPIDPGATVIRVDLPREERP